MLTIEQFLEHLRDALNHLYDPDHLRRSPLAALLGAAERFDTPYVLQRILTEAIANLEPAPGVRPLSPARQTYELLFYRYVQQFSQREVADQLGMSVRHLRRKQHGALEILAYHLWEQLRLPTEVHGSVGEQPAEKPEVGPSVAEELAWLRDSPAESSAELARVLPAVRELARPLSDQHNCGLKMNMPDHPPTVAVHPVALRQALLSLLSVAIRRAQGREVVLSVRPSRWETEIKVHAPTVSECLTGPSDHNADSLSMARQLAELCRGRLIVSSEERSVDACLIIPTVERLPVLVIDDNADTLQLLQRYASGTRYHLITTREPEQAVELAEEYGPQIIVLDVMMPDVDGWEVLARLRQHPLVDRIPIIVCTILAQEDLALSLGATAFIHKPVSRRGFLAALDHQVSLMEPESR